MSHDRKARPARQAKPLRALVSARQMVAAFNRNGAQTSRRRAVVKLRDGFIRQLPPPPRPSWLARAGRMLAATRLHNGRALEESADSLRRLGGHSFGPTGGGRVRPPSRAKWTARVGVIYLAHASAPAARKPRGPATEFAGWPAGPQQAATLCKLQARNGSTRIARRAERAAIGRIPPRGRASIRLFGPPAAGAAERPVVQLLRARASGQRQIPAR